ncbi:DgyrCDS243 [Dimorphilus gyrociliatus]|uniref:Nephrocystin-3 n=1 Tax=Dimorphilus gyrociliatus TaxID=2664684 RepID=A0A7I8V6J5_9ANNE|nr:DgyrCDS243 [Dimorphilus gyrociliatus]
MGNMFKRQSEVHIDNEIKARPKLGGKKPPKNQSVSGSQLSQESHADTEDSSKLSYRELEIKRKTLESELNEMKILLTKLEDENRRMKNENRAMQRTRDKLAQEKEQALEAAENALSRSNFFEQDRDKIQRQFKIFRETKESEIQNLLQARRDLEQKLSRFATIDENDGSHFDLTNGNWWSHIGSEPSLGSMVHLNNEKNDFNQNQIVSDTGTPYLTINKDDWHTAMANLSQIMPSFEQHSESSVFKIFVSAAQDALPTYELFKQKHFESLQSLCLQAGKGLLFVLLADDFDKPIAHLQNIARQTQREDCNIFLAFWNNQSTNNLKSDFDRYILFKEDAKPVVICLNSSCSNETIIDMKLKVSKVPLLKLFEYSQFDDISDSVAKELESCMKRIMDMEPPSSDEIKPLCQVEAFDPMTDFEQHDLFKHFSNSSCEIRFELLYEKINSHVSPAGPLSPLIVHGYPGSGKSLLLAKWIELQQQKREKVNILYHFVDDYSSPSALCCLIMRRFSQKLLSYVPNPPSMSYCPEKLISDFVKWLEKVSSRISNGIILIIDNAHMILNVETMLNWLHDPLPVNVRVLLSVASDKMPPSWKSWPSCQLESHSKSHIRSLFLNEWTCNESLHSTFEFTEDQLNFIVEQCSLTDSKSVSRFIILLVRSIGSLSKKDTFGENIRMFAKCVNCEQLYETILRHSSKILGGDIWKITSKILKLIFVSHCGLTEAEIFQLVPSLNWNTWGAIWILLEHLKVLKNAAGLITLENITIKKVINRLKTDDKIDTFQISLEKVDKFSNTNYFQILIDYFKQFMKPGKITHRTADELPWLYFQISDKNALHSCVANLCIFNQFFSRGRCDEIVLYWQNCGSDRETMATEYMTSLKGFEDLADDGPDSFITLPKVAEMYEALGLLLRELGMFEQALRPLEKSLELREAALDPDHISIGRSLQQLGILNTIWGKYGVAEQLHKNALEIFEASPDCDSKLLGKQLDLMAQLFMRQNKQDSAEPYRRRAMSVIKSSQGQGHVLRKKAAVLEDMTIGPDSPEQARTLNDLGVLQFLQGNTKSAEPLLLKSMEMRKAVFGHNHLDVAQSYHNLAALYTEMQKFEEAMKFYETALQIRRDLLDKKHPQIISSLMNLASLRKKVGEIEEAIRLFQQAADLREENLGCLHPLVAADLANLAVLLSQLKRHNDAIPLYERALRIYEETLGPQNGKIGDLLKNMALSRYEQGHFQIAAKLYRRATDLTSTLRKSVTSDGLINDL